MSGRLVRAAWGVAVVAGVAVAALVGLGALGPFGRHDDVATAGVERGDFARWVPADGVLEAVESTSINVPRLVDAPLRLAWIAPEGTLLAPGDVALKFDPTDVERTLADRRADLESNGLQLDKQKVESRSQTENLERDAEIAGEKLKHAQEFATKDETIYSRVEIIESQIDQNLAAQELDKARSASRREEATAEADRRLLTLERKDIETDLARARRIADSLSVRAPHAGFLVYKRDWRGDPPRVGDTVYPGQVLAEIPRLGSMEVQAFVLEADAGGLAEGKPARVHLEAHPGAVYAATIQQVDKVAKPRHRGSPVQYFAVTLKLGKSDPKLMKAGQRVHAEILLDDLHGVLTVPRQAVFERQGRTVAYRRSGKGFEPVLIETGATGRGRVVVRKGLSSGDEVALEDPTAPTGSGAVAPGAVPGSPGAVPVAGPAGSGGGMP